MAIVLIFLGCVLAPVSVLGVWAANQVSDTGRYVANVEPLIHDPAIQNALTDKITTQITSRLNVTGVVNQASAQLNSRGLPRISSLLKSFAPQISSSVTGFIHSTVHWSSQPALANAWVQVDTVAHAQIVKVLSGQGNSSISVKNGQVVISLGPFIDIVKKDLVAAGSRWRTHPAINPTVTVFEAKNLEKAQTGYRLINDLKIVLPILALLLIAAGIYIARSHRRALIGAGLGFAFAMLVLGAVGDLPEHLPQQRPQQHAAQRCRRRPLRHVCPLHQGCAPCPARARADRRRRGVLHRALGHGGPDPLGDRVGAGLDPALQRPHRSIRRPRRPVDLRAPQGPPIGAAALAALIFVFLGQPTAVSVIVIVVVLLVVLALIELIGRPPGQGGDRRCPVTTAPVSAVRGQCSPVSAGGSGRGFRARPSPVPAPPPPR